MAGGGALMKLLHETVIRVENKSIWPKNIYSNPTPQTHTLTIKIITKRNDYEEFEDDW